MTDGGTTAPVLPVFGQITPFPATPLYERLAKEGRLTRSKHWLDFAPFLMAHTPLRMTDRQVHDEVRKDSISDEPAPYKTSHLVESRCPENSLATRRV